MLVIALLLVGILACYSLLYPDHWLEKAAGGILLAVVLVDAVLFYCAGML